MTTIGYKLIRKRLLKLLPYAEDDSSKKKRNFKIQWGFDPSLEFQRNGINLLLGQEPTPDKYLGEHDHHAYHSLPAFLDWGNEWSFY